MGEHKDDKSLEQILEEEAQENARLLAEREAEALRSDASFHCYWKHIAVNCREISVWFALLLFFRNDVMRVVKTFLFDICREKQEEEMQRKLKEEEQKLAEEEAKRINDDK